jgi:cob(I)alamin adenosyltransferase
MVKISLVYGEGKGKTTNAMGKMYFYNSKRKEIVVIQFLKTGKNCGECEYFKKFDNVRWFCIGEECFYTDSSDKEYFMKIIEKGIEKLMLSLKKQRTDILFLDELGITLFFNLTDWNTVTDAFKFVNEEVFITGRKVPNEIRKKAHKLVYVEEKKHPYNSGIAARLGIDY